MLAGIACLATSSISDEILGSQGGRSAPSSLFKVGQPFPNITLPSLKDGKPASIADFRGHKLILHIFASW
jgi:hypothetical protein